uniref:Uncharacterized protein n=1 Tax=Triticum urartu TaxID=4572 RepID=A0A8R7VD14_TRIUA
MPGTARAPQGPKFSREQCGWSTAGCGCSTLWRQRPRGAGECLCAARAPSRCGLGEAWCRAGARDGGHGLALLATTWRRGPATGVARARPGGGGAWRDCINIDDCGVGGAAHDAHTGGRPCREPTPLICTDVRFRRGRRSRWFRSPSPARGRGQT